MPTSPQFVHPSAIQTKTVAVAPQEASLDLQNHAVRRGKKPAQTMGLVTVMAVIVSTLAMLILITVNAPAIVFGVLTVKAIVLMWVMNQKKL